MIRSPQNNERGLAVLPIAIVVSIVLGTIFYYASLKSDHAMHSYRVAHGVAYAEELSVKFAQKIRYSYDIARAVSLNATNAGLCTSLGGNVETVGAVRLCLVGRRVCVFHPRNISDQVCVSLDDSSLVARHRYLQPHELMARLLVSQSLAQTISTPAVPPAAETSNVLSGAPNCIGGSCGATCGGDADCVSYRFCPLTTACEPDQFVWQTIAFLR